MGHLVIVGLFGGGRFFKMGGLVKLGKISLSRWVFVSGGFFGGGRAISLSLVVVWAAPEMWVGCFWRFALYCWSISIISSC